MKTKNFLTSSFIVALASATICAPAANAAPNEAELGSPNQFLESNSNLALKSISDFERIAAETKIDFNAEIQLIDSKSSEVLQVTDPTLTIEEILKNAGYDSTDFRTADNEAISEDLKIENDSTIDLFGSEISGTSKVIKMKVPVERVETDELYEGEEEVKEEGRDGEALKTIVSTKSLANDEKINDTASKNKGSVSNTVEEKLTILKSPKAKVIHVGTKERVTEELRTPSTNEESSVESSVEPQTESSTSSRSNSSNQNNTSQNISRNSVGNAASASQSEARSGTYSATDPITTKVEVKLGNDGAESSISKTAAAQVGKPYIWGATGPSAFDCSGFIYWVKAQHGKSVPRTSGGQWGAATPISGSELRAGDILWKPGHIAMYIGNGKVVHASSPKTGVIYGTANDMLSRGYKAGRL